MISLPQVTLCTLGSEKYREAHQKALDYSCKGIQFGAVKNIIQDCNNIDEWNHAIIYDLYKYIETDFCILIHHDGYIINPNLWRDEWLNFDFIGAPFPLPRDSFSYRDSEGRIQRVGNSVSLRSKRLIELAPKLGLEWKAFHGYTNEDGFICVNYRHVYEANGMKFAPLDVAVHFSKEHEIEENKGLETFAFHSL